MKRSFLPFVLLIWKQKVQSSPRHTDAGGTVQRLLSADQHSVRSYGRKKSQSKSQLKSESLPALSLIIVIIISTEIRVVVIIIWS